MDLTRFQDFRVDVFDEHLSDNELALAIERIPEIDLYMQVKKHGLDNSIRILQLISAEKMQALLDLDCWNNFDLDISDAFVWLETLRTLEFSSFWEKFEKLDQDFWIAFFQNFLVVDDKTKEGEDTFYTSSLNPRIDRSKPVFETEDGFFYVQVKLPEHETWDPELEHLSDIKIEDVIWSFLKDYYKFDLQKAYSFLQAIRWELPADSTEQALLFRDARLSDLGLPTWEEANEIFIFLSREKRSAIIESGHVKNELFTDDQKSGLVSKKTSKNIFSDILTVLNGEQQRDLIAQFTRILNSVLVATKSRPGSRKNMQFAVNATEGFLSLAFNLLENQDYHSIAQKVLQNGLKTFFRLGLSEVHEITFSLQGSMRKSGFLDARYSYGLAFDTLVEGLTKKLPMVPISEKDFVCITTSEELKKYHELAVTFDVFLQFCFYFQDKLKHKVSLFEQNHFEKCSLQKFVNTLFFWLGYFYAQKQDISFDEMCVSINKISNNDMKKFFDLQCIELLQTKEFKKVFFDVISSFSFQEQQKNLLHSLLDQWLEDFCLETASCSDSAERTKIVSSLILYQAV